MAAVTIRGLSDETHLGLKARAAKNGRSTEAEIRAILDETVFPPGREGMGTKLSRIWRDVGLTEEEADQLVDSIQSVRELTREYPDPHIFE
jgi:plasmid stability protein